MLARGSNKDSFILSLLAHLRRVCEDDGAGGGGSLRLHTRPHAVTQPFCASSVREPRRCRLPPRRPTAGRGARWRRASASYGFPSTAKHIPNDFDITFTNGRLRIAFGAVPLAAPSPAGQPQRRRLGSRTSPHDAGAPHPEARTRARESSSLPAHHRASGEPAPSEEGRAALSAPRSSGRGPARSAGASLAGRGRQAAGPPGR